MAVISTVSYESARQTPELLAFLTAAIENPKALTAVLAELKENTKISAELIEEKTEALKTIAKAVTLSNEVAQEAKEFQEHKGKIEKHLEELNKKLEKDKLAFSEYVAKVEAQIKLFDTEQAQEKGALAIEAKRLAALKAEIDVEAKSILKDKKDFATAVAKFDATVAAKSKELDERDAAITAREDVFRTVAKQLG